MSLNIKTDIGKIKVADVGGSSGGSVSSNFSTDETEVGTWIDGRTLYQKTILYTQNISGTTNIQHNIENLDYCTHFNGIIFDRDGYGRPLNGVIHDFGTTLSEFAINRTNVYMVTKGATWGGIMITINYVKS